MAHRIVDILFLFLLIAAAIWVAALISRSRPLILGLAVIVIGAIFGPEFYSVRVGPLPVTCDRILWGGFCLLILSNWMLRRDGRLFHFSAIDLAILSLLILIAVSTFTHDWRLNNKLPLGRLIFFQLIPTSFFWLGRHTCFQQKDLKWFLTLGLGFGVYLALTGIAEKYGMHELVFPKYIVTSENYEFFGRARGPFINPIGNGLMMVFAVACCCQLWKNSKQSGRIMLCTVFLLLSAGIYCTMTRSVWLGFFLSLAVVAWFSFPLAARGALITSGVLASLLFVFALSPYLNQFKRDQYVSAEEMGQSARLRPMLIAVALEMHQEKPILGHGYGQYQKVSEKYHRTDHWNMDLQTVQPYLQHNLFLAYLTELGLAGLSLILLIYACFVYNACRLLTEPWLASDYRMFSLVVLVVNLNMVINGMFHDVSLIVVVGSLFFFLNGLAYSIRDRNLAQDWSEAPAPVSAPITL